MPSLESVIKFREEMFHESVSIIKQKGHDYNRQQQETGDTLFNLRVAEILGIVPTAERGILVRLSDKFMRLISLMSPGVEAQVKGESVRDTVRDFHNYLDYCLQIWEERRRAEASKPGQVIALNKDELDSVYVREHEYSQGLVPEKKMGVLRNKVSDFGYK